MKKDINPILPTIIIATSISFVVIVVIYLLSFSAFDTFNKDEHSRQSTANALIFTGLLATAITIGFLYANYRQQQSVIGTREDEIRDNKLDVEYNRAIDVIYRQLEINKQTYERIKPTVDKVDNHYKIEGDVRKILNQIMTIALNYYTMCVTIEQFLSRTNLPKWEQSYLFLLYEENIPPSIKLPLIKLNSYLQNYPIANNTIFRRRKSYENIYIKLVLPDLIAYNDSLGGTFSTMTDLAKTKMILKDLKGSPKVLQTFANLCMTTVNTLNTRERIIHDNMADRLQ